MTPAPDTGRTAEEKRLGKKAAQLARIVEAQTAQLRAENASLRQIIADCATAIGNGAAVGPECSLEFMSWLPKEIAGVTSKLRADLRESAMQHIARDLGDEQAAEEIAHLRAENANLRDRVREAEGAGRDPDGSEPLPAVEPLRVSPAPAAAVSRAAKLSRTIEIMNDYADAYMAANKKSPDFRLLYANGWVLFQSIHSHCTLDKRRLSHIVGMTERLRARANDERAQRENAKRSSPKDASVVGEAEAPDPLSPEPQEAGDHEPR